MQIRLLILIFLGNLLSIQAQDYFLKTYAEPTATTTQSFIAPGNLGSFFQASRIANSELSVRKVDKCGNVVWTRQIKHDSLPMGVLDCKTDLNGNLIVSGNLGNSISNYEPYILSLTSNGNINYFKRLRTIPAVQTIHYSMGINKKGEVLLYFNYDIGSSGPPSSSILKLSPSAQLLSFKSYSAIGNWGRAITTNDNGMLLRAGSNIVKVDSLGNVDWARSFFPLGYVDYPVEIEGGYILFKYPSGAGSPSTNVMKLDKKGIIKWTSNDFNNFRPQRGILRKNGNVLFTGRAQGGIGLLELDTTSGEIIHFKEFDPNGSSALMGIDIMEDTNENILISGIDNSGFQSTLNLLKLDDSLNLPNCISAHLNSLTTKTETKAVFTPNVNPISRSLQLIQINDEPYQDTLLGNSTYTSSCSTFKDRGDYDLGIDTTLCPNESILIGNNNSSFDSYKWSTGSTNKQIQVTSAGQYRLEVISACDTLRDTININYNPRILIDLGRDTTICYDDSLTLKTNNTLPNYLWSNNEITPTITVKAAGNYWLESTGICGSIRDSILIEEYAPSKAPNLGVDTSICPNTTLKIGPENRFLEYLWSNGSTNPQIEVRDSGMYSLRVIDHCDTLYDSIKVKVFPSIEVRHIINKSRLKTHEELLFEDISLASAEAEWEMGNGEKLIGKKQSYAYPIQGAYQIQQKILSLDGCYFYDSIPILVLPSDYSIPNVFTPNGDQINDLFYPDGKDILSYQTTVIDRWGNEVFNSRKIPWDGRNTEGKPLSNGVYFYEIDILWNYGTEQHFTGTVSLLR